jgi:four helix bundle protein
MSRDPDKLRVFRLADTLLLEAYRLTSAFPADERYGLRAQIRRAAVSTATNIVEGSARRTTAEYVNFLNVVAGSAAETRYLIGVSSRLGFLSEETSGALVERYTELLKGLLRLTNSLIVQSPKPGA